MSIGLFPPKRRVIIEKNNKVKSLTKGLFRMEMVGFERPESFLVDCVSPIVMRVVYAYPVIPLEDDINNRFPIRTQWEPIRVRVIECEGPGNGRQFMKWVNSYFYSERGHKAASMKFRRLYDDGRDSIELDLWSFHGCMPASVCNENNSIFIEFHINHGFTKP